MRTVDIQELGQSLIEYLREFEGSSILIVDRGRAVAEISVLARRAEGVPPALESLARRGLVTLGSGSNRKVGAYVPLPRTQRGSTGSSALLDEERGSH